MNNLTLYAVPQALWEQLPRDRSLASLAEEALRNERQILNRVTVVNSIQRYSDLAIIIAEKTALLAQSEPAIAVLELNRAMTQELLGFYEQARAELAMKLSGGLSGCLPQQDIGRIFCCPGDMVKNQILWASDIRIGTSDLCSDAQRLKAVSRRLHFYQQALTQGAGVVEFLS